MARCKTYNCAQMKMVAVSYERQILPGTFEHTLNHLIDHAIDLAPFAARYVNDETGAPAPTAHAFTTGGASPVGARIAERMARMCSGVAARGLVFTCPLFIAHSARRSRSASVFTC